MQHTIFESAVYPLHTLLTLPQERLLIAKRKHWIVPLMKFIQRLLQGGILIIFMTIALVFFAVPVDIILLGAVAIVLLTAARTTKIIFDWYCHLYIITTHKLLEICDIPLFADTFNEVLLDQVRCTEVDAQKNNVFNKFFNYGDVTITFDRPTHKEEFTLEAISDPEQTCMLLVDAFHLMKYETQFKWFKDNKDKDTDKLRFIEEIRPLPFNGGIL